MKSIIIITNGNYFSKLILEELFKKCNKSISGVLIITGDYRAKTGIKSLIWLFKKMAFPFFLYKAYINFVFIAIKKIFKNTLIDVERLAKYYNIPIKKEKYVNSMESIKWVKQFEPDLIISVSCPQRIKTTMLSIPTDGAINIHSSLLPAYAGLAPYFWVLSKGEKETGITVHYMTIEFDYGNILAQKRINIEKGESSLELFLRLSKIGSDLLLEAIDKIKKGNKGIEQNKGLYSYYSHPKFMDYIQLRKRGHKLISINKLINIIGEEIKGYKNHEG